MRNPFRVLAPALVLLSSLPAFAQYSIDKILIHNAAPYSDADVLSVAGLQPGQFLAHDSLGNAAQHVLDTGLFDDAQVDFTGVGKARTVIFSLKPKPVDTLMPTSFVNFVWFTPEELNTALHSKIPLYRGFCSDAGTFADTIQSALQQMLATKGISATLSHTIVEPTSEYPIRIVSFRVEDPAVRLASVNLIGWPPELAAQLKRVQTRLVDRGYDEGIGYTTLDALLAPLRDAGYISSRVENLQRTPTAGSAVQVALTATVVPGTIYKVSAFTSDAPPFDHSARQARRARYIASLKASHTSVVLPELPTTMQPGDVASASVLRAIMAGIVYDFRSTGHLDAYVNPNPTLDDQAHTVAYALHAIPGDLYHLKSITPLNLSAAAQAEFDQTWSLKPGDIYNPDYVNNFIADTPGLKNLASYNATFQATADPQTHLVDLTLTFMPNGR